MIKEKSAGFIIYHKENNKVTYLILQYAYTSRHWDFPRGGVEKNENEITAAYREIKEETGLHNLKHINGFIDKSEWDFKRFGKPAHKEIIWFIAESDNKSVILSKEHYDYKWLSAEEILNTLSYEHHKPIFNNALKFLKSKGIIN